MKQLPAYFESVNSDNSTDIVAMLRHEYEHFNNSGVGDYELLTAAADEIERLRESINGERELAWACPVCKTAVSSVIRNKGKI